MFPMEFNVQPFIRSWLCAVMGRFFLLCRVRYSLPTSGKSGLRGNVNKNDDHLVPTFQAHHRNYRHDSPRRRPRPPSIAANSQKLLHPPKALLHHCPPLADKLHQPLPYPPPEPYFTTTHPRIRCKLCNGVTQTESPLTIELPRHHSPVWIFKGSMFRLRQFTTSRHCRLPLASWPLFGFLLLFPSLFLFILPPSLTSSNSSHNANEQQQPKGGPKQAPSTKTHLDGPSSRQTRATLATAGNLR